MTDTDIDTDPGTGPDPGDEPTTRRGVPGRTVVLVAAVVALLIGAVVYVIAARPGDDDPDPEPTTTTAARTTTTSDEEPPGTEPDAVEPYVADLLTRYDEVTAQILADPGTAANVNDPLYSELRSVMDPNSEMTTAIVETLVDRGEQGESLVAVEGAELPITRTVDGDVETLSADEVRFPLCTRYDYRLETDTRIELGDGHDRRSAGTAVRIDGNWVLSRLEGNDDIIECEEEP